MRLALIALISALGSTAVLAPDGAAQTASMPSTAARPALPAPSTDAFLTKVAAANSFEIESSKLALRRATSEKVKSFANRMVNDHGVAARKFRQAVSEARLDPPPETMDAKHLKLVAGLEEKVGGAFEADYVSAQRAAHLETVALFESYAATGDNARIRQFAQEFLPTMREHLEHVGRLRDSGT